jgi:mercuric reductase
MTAAIPDPITRDALARLNALLPLAERQAALPEPLRTLHRRVLHALAASGRAPRLAELAAPGLDDVAAGLDALRRADLVVLGAPGEPLGAYPVTLEDTPHRVVIGRHSVNAMCSVDALAVSPMFGVTTRIASRCHHCGAPLAIAQHDRELEPERLRDVLRVGIAWRAPGCCAAHSLCREMAFFCDEAHARAWGQAAGTECSVLTLAQAIDLARAFFLPLVGKG